MSAARRAGARRPDPGSFGGEAYLDAVDGTDVDGERPLLEKIACVEATAEDSDFNEVVLRVLAISLRE